MDLATCKGSQLCIYLFCFGAIPSGAQRLFLTLHSGITVGSVWETRGEARA